MDLVVFDLDYTLISDDSSKLWNEFVFDQGLIDSPEHLFELRQFNQAYHAGCLDIDAYQRFTMQLFPRLDIQNLLSIRETFIREKIEPIILDKGVELLNHHKSLGDCRVLISATNRFITDPLRQRWGMEVNLSTEPALSGRNFNGEVEGIPSYGKGKVDNIKGWMEKQFKSFDNVIFYSDSHTDLPLLEWAHQPIAVDPDPTLKSHAMEKGWTIMSLR